MISIECVFDVDTELEVFDRLKVGPAEEVGEEDDTGHGVEFFGGGAGEFAESSEQFSDGHFFEEDMPEQGLPSLGDNFGASWSDELFEGVEKSLLSRIDFVNHGERNPL